LTAGLGESWLIESNGHKPYACGVVLHPLIDAMVALRQRIGGAAVSAIELRVHPWVLSITRVVEPSSGLQSKFSWRHPPPPAPAPPDAPAERAKYPHGAPADPAVAALRCKVRAAPDDTLRSDEVHAAVIADGTRHEVHVAHASGTAANPMSDAGIEAKFLANAIPVIGEKRARRACELVWSFEAVADVRALLALVA